MRHILRSRRLFPLDGEIDGVIFLWCLFLVISKKVYFQERNSCFFETIRIQATRNNTSTSQYPTKNTLSRLVLGHICSFYVFNLFLSFAPLLNLKSLLHTHISMHVQDKQNCFAILIWICVLSLETAACLHVEVEWPLTTIINNSKFIPVPIMHLLNWGFF